MASMKCGATKKNRCEANAQDGMAPSPARRWPKKMDMQYEMIAILMKPMRAAHDTARGERNIKVDVLMSASECVRLILRASDQCWSHNIDAEIDPIREHSRDCLAKRWNAIKSVHRKGEKINYYFSMNSTISADSPFPFFQPSNGRREFTNGKIATEKNELKFGKRHSVERSRKEHKSR